MKKKQNKSCCFFFFGSNVVEQKYFAMIRVQVLRYALNKYTFFTFIVYVRIASPHFFVRSLIDNVLCDCVCVCMSNVYKPTQNRRGQHKLSHPPPRPKRMNVCVRAIFCFSSPILNEIFFSFRYLYTKRL